jgi:hypothetical protein
MAVKTDGKNYHLVIILSVCLYLGVVTGGVVSFPVSLGCRGGVSALSHLSVGSPQGGRVRVSSRCAFLAQRDALGVPASLFAEPSALRLSLGSFFVHGARRVSVPALTTDKLLNLIKNG